MFRSVLSQVSRCRRSSFGPTKFFDIPPTRRFWPRVSSATPQVSVLEAHRAGGRVTNEHIASLGSVERPPSVQARQLFWANLWDRLTGLSNRIGADDQAKIRNAVHARIPMVMPEEANADEAKYLGTYSAEFAKTAAEERARAARAYQDAIEQAEITEKVAMVFASNRAAALKGERPMDRVVVGQILAAKVGFKQTPDGTPCIMANGEAGVVRTPKRYRNDRRRRRGGMRYTPKAGAQGDSVKS